MKQIKKFACSVIVLCMIFSMLPMTVFAADLTASGTCGDNLTWELTNDGVLTISGTGTMTNFGYQEAPWYGYAEEIVRVDIENGVTSIGNYAFDGCSSLTEITFQGDAPVIIDDAFGMVTATAYYPAENATWTAEKLQSYGGDITWVSYSTGSEPTPAEPETSEPIRINTATLSFTDKDAARTSYSIEEQVWEQNGVKLTNNKAGSTSNVGDYAPLRLYKSSSVTIECAGMTKIVFYCNDYKDTYAEALKNSITDIDATVTVDGQVVTVEYSEPRAAFTILSMSAQVRVDSLTVTYAESSEPDPSEPETSEPAPTEPTGDALTIVEANMLGLSYAHNTFTTKKYNVTGIVKEIKNTTYGNIYIQDAEGNTLYIYGIFNEDGTVRFGAMENIPAVGDTVTLYGIIGQYNGIAQMMDGWIVEHNTGETPTEPVEPSGPIPTEPETTASAPAEPEDPAEVVASGTCGENLTWELTDDGTLTISGTGVMADYSWCDAPWDRYRTSITEVVIEAGVTSIGNSAFWCYNSLTDITIPDSVVSIGYFAFRACHSLTSIIIPDSVTSIGDDAFYGCSSLTGIWVNAENPSYSSDEFGVLFDKNKTVLLQCPGILEGEYTIPDSVTSIGNDAFSYCSSLTDITIPGSVTSIGDCAFFWCSSLTGITIPEGVTSIGNSAFSYCSSLTNITIPEGVTSIGDHAFSSCYSLNSVTIPDSVTSIGYSAFGDCSSLTGIWVNAENPSYSSDEFGVLFDKNKTVLLQYPGGLEGEYTIPEGVTSIGDSTLSNCSSLTGIIIPDGVTSIGDCAFYNCSSLTDISIPDSVTSIGDEAFKYCTKLTDITFEGNAPAIGNYIFSEVTATAYYPAGNATWTEDVMQSYGGTTITWEAYTPGGEPDTPKVVASGTCGENLTWELTDDGVLTIPGTGTMAGYSWCDAPWYSYRTSITEVVIEEGVTSIGDSAFWYCDSLTDITIPDSVVSIGNYAFNGCSSLAGITIPESVTSIGIYAFSECSSLTGITIPDGVTSIDDYAFSWCSNLTSITIPDSVTSIGDCAFFRCSSLTGITIPEGVTSIGNSAFSDCSSLTGITIPVSVTTIGDSVFWGCSKLTSITIPKDVTSIGDNAFYHCSSLTNVTIPDGVTCIGDSTFSDCGSLTGIIIPKGVTSIGDRAFYHCSSLTHVTIPDGVTSIGNYAFCGCSVLTNITIPDSVTSIGNYAFCGCSGLTNITIPDSVTNIGNYAFCGCSVLTNITIPDSVTNIGNYAFDGCSSLTGIIIPEGVTSIGDQAFSSCYSLTSINIPESVTSIGCGAFYYCSSLTNITIPEGVTSIGDQAFCGCNKLTSITILEGVTSIGNCAFSWCESLTGITFEGNAPAIGTGAFSGVTATAYYPADNVTWTEDVMQSYGGTIIWTLSGSMEVVASGTCGENLTWVLTDDGVLTISGTGTMTNFGYQKAPWYGYAEEIVRVDIESGVTSIGSCAFMDCSSLTNITIPDSVTIIGGSVFSGCSSLTGITIPDSVTSIGNSAFSECSSLTSITIPDSVTSIGNSAFSECSSLTGITIPEGVTSVGDFAFSQCSSLTNITIPEGVTTIGDYAFFFCGSLTSIIIPDSVTSIGDSVFTGCSSLTDITIPHNVTSIGNSAFSACYNLTDITFCGDAPVIDSIAFCNVNATAHYPANNSTWTEDVMQSYGGTITWEAFIHEHTYGEWVIIKAPTFTAGGTQQKTCSVCGDVLTEEIQPIAASVKEWNISLVDDLQVHFHLLISECIESTAKVRISLANETLTYNVRDLEKTEEGLYVVSVELAAAQMTEDIVLLIVDKNQIGCSAIYTVRQYADTVLADESLSKYHKLVREMLNYGAAAQNYFGYDLDVLANEGITGVSEAEIPEVANEPMQITGAAEGVSFYAASLSYRERIAVRFYFNFTGDINACTFTVNGEELSPGLKNGLYYVDIPGITPEKLDQQVELTVTDANGNSLVVSYSPMNYMVRMNAKGSERLKELLKALYNYHLAAKELKSL